MSADDSDLDELRSIVDDLDRSVEQLRQYGTDHDIPAIERSAARLAGSLEAIKQNVPGALDGE